MATHEVEVKPYGTKNEVETRVYPTTSTGRSDADALKPPYGQKNESVSTTTPQSSSYNIGGSRTDVEVKPFGATEIRDTGVQKPQRVTTTTTVRPLANVDWRNPLLATLLGITLALSLLSLSYLPRAISGLWHWGTGWTHWGSGKSYDESLTKSYMHDMAQQKGSNMYQSAMDTVNNAKDRVESTGESLYERAKQTGENMLNTAKDTVYTSHTGSMTQDAKRAACQAADRAKHAACDGIDMSRWTSSGSMMPDTNQVKDAAYEASNRASGLYEQAKQKVGDVLEAAKDTVTYPINVAGQRLQQTRETVMQAGNNVADSARDATYSTIQGAKDRVEGIPSQVTQAAKDTIHGAENIANSALHAAKDTVLGAGQAAKDTVLGAGQAAKDTVVGAGQAVKNMAGNTAQAAKDTVRNAASSSSSENIETNHRGPTRVKVEVQEL
jgi:hypothetical protein